MIYTVYIIQSEKDGSYYKGYTSNLERRLNEHNTGRGRYTSTKYPWKLVYKKIFYSKREALIFERKIKNYNSTYLKKFIERRAD